MIGFCFVFRCAGGFNGDLNFHNNVIVYHVNTYSGGLMTFNGVGCGLIDTCGLVIAGMTFMVGRKDRFNR